MLLKKSSGVSWIVAFLGNPGPQYENTRHNAGFMAGDALSKEKGVAINKSRFRALTGLWELEGQKVLLMKPQTFMNLSGEAVRQAADYYKIPPERIIIVSDEMSLPTGKIRVKPSGSAGGHNGLKNVIACLGSSEFPRIRIGVGRGASPEEMKDYVLGSFSQEDSKLIKEAAARAAAAVESIILNGCEATMNKFN